MTTEFWRWPETKWKASDKDWRQARIISCGIDVGSVSSKALIAVDGEPFSYSCIRTGSNSELSATRVLEVTLDGTGLKKENIRYVVATGYGRVNVSFAQRQLTEIACHARGANYIYGPLVRTILDMGGQDCKAIRCDENGKVKAFLMNDKCAAGTGRGLETFADLVRVPIQKMGEMSLDVTQEPEPLPSECTIFARADAARLLAQGISTQTVLASYCRAVTRRVCSLLGQLGMEKDFAITGGISKNIGVVKRIESELGVKAAAPKRNIDAVIAGALGAALFAHNIVLKSQAA